MHYTLIQPCHTPAPEESREWEDLISKTKVPCNTLGPTGRHTINGSFANNAILDVISQKESGVIGYETGRSIYNNETRLIIRLKTMIE